MSKKIFITAPIFYVNGKPHIGHLYTSFAVDVISKWEKLLGNQVFVSVGTDEHGQKVESAANKNQQTPKEFVDQSYLPFKQMLDQAGIDYNTFVRTTNETHKQTAIHIWNKLAKFTYVKSYKGWYSKTDEAYYKEDEIADGRCIDTGSEVEYMEEECIFFKLSDFKDKLLQFYQHNPEVIQPKSKYHEVIGLLRADLPDLAISRSRFNWGIPVPNNPNHVMYVWVDALTNYLTVLNYPRNQEFERYWHNTIHVIGKDILKFHAIYWPAILFAAEIPVPKRIFAHGWWTVDHQKMSKSIGNTVDPFYLFKDYHSDAIRYFMFSEVNFGNDGNFSERGLKHVINTQLANELGNLIQRVCMFCYTKYGRTIAYSGKADLLQIWDETLDTSIKCMETQNISGYLHACRAAIIHTNQYIENTKPWGMENPQETLGILCLCLQRIVLLYHPLLPTKMHETAKMLGMQEVNMQRYWNIHESYPLAKPGGIFQRIAV